MGPAAVLSAFPVSLSCISFSRFISMYRRVPSGRRRHAAIGPLRNEPCLAVGVRN